MARFILFRALLLLLAPAVVSAGPRTWVEWLRGERESAQTPLTTPDANRWEPLLALLKGWEFTTNYAITIGNAKGRLFKYEGGNFTLKTQVPTASTSKWPSAMMFAGLVNDGTVASLDDPVNKYLPWWTKNTSDLRSMVTFRMLLSFTSGFGGGHPGEESNTLAARRWRSAANVPRQPLGATLKERLAKEIGAEAAEPCGNMDGDVVSCAKSIYDGVQLIGTPGKVYSYNSNHLMIAAAVAVSASGLGIQEVIHKYLIDPFGMNHSSYPGSCPDFAGDLLTTGEDYESFLFGLLSYKALSKEIVDASEEDATPFMSDWYTLYGNYGFGHFLMCFDSVDGMTDACREAKCHMDPGGFGFIPILDRKNEYYLQVATAEIAPTGSYPLSGIPEYLAVAMKPHVDAILSSHPPDSSEHLAHTPRFLSLSIADVNYCLGCVLNPSSCS